MQGGDISAEVPPRILVVFEGLIGLLPGRKAEAQFALYRRTHRYAKAAALFELNDAAVRRIWDMTWRHRHAVDAVTFLGEEFAEPLRDVMDREQVPIGHLTVTEPHLLARELAYRPDIVAVYDANPANALTYGAKGRHTNPHQPNFLN
jgi:hypothetical protein